MTAGAVDVLQFVASHEIEPTLFERSDYVTAEEKVSKPYALFTAVLTETKRDAIAKVTMHNREHVVLIRPVEGGRVLQYALLRSRVTPSQSSGSPEIRVYSERARPDSIVIKQRRRASVISLMKPLKRSLRANLDAGRHEEHPKARTTEKAILECLK